MASAGPVLRYQPYDGYCVKSSLFRDMGRGVEKDIDRERGEAGERVRGGRRERMKGVREKRESGREK